MGDKRFGWGANGLSERPVVCPAGKMVCPGSKGFADQMVCLSTNCFCPGGQWFFFEKK